MNKSEAKEVAKLTAYAASHADIAARGLSALVRAARTKASTAALMAVAQNLGLVGNDEFIL